MSNTLLTDNRLELHLPDEFIEFSAATGCTPRWILEQFISDVVPIFNRAGNPRPDNYVSGGHNCRALASAYFGAICRIPDRSLNMDSEPASTPSPPVPQLLKRSVDQVLGAVCSHRSGTLVDSIGEPIAPGKYLLARAGAEYNVKVWEDSTTSDLWLLVIVNGQEVKQRVDELAEECVLTRIG